MGIAGAFMLGAIFCLFKSISSLLSVTKWKSKGKLTTARVTSLEDKKIIGNPDKPFEITYIYNVEVDGETVKYNERYMKKQDSCLKVGDTYNVYYDSINKTMVDADIISKDLKTYPIGFVICVLGLIITTYIAVSLGR